MGRRRVIEEVLLHRIAVEPGDHAQPADDRRPGPPLGFQVAGEALNVGAAGLEQAQMMLVAPARILAQVQPVRFASQAAVPGQESR